ncbi:hypothetical protein BN938_2192 [Mucinivorans hirudinis]|uniref:Uncharacterized protein n=1 Tax=Mucinivorans hirudinis TaxID=1433126 RepID=A0A060RE05_9BACT|nr:hypothetical protein BN938_2192 [Mucinivorans hirudinis]
MKKLLLIFVAALVCIAPMAQTPQQQETVTIEKLSEKIDSFVDSQNQVNEKLEKKINNANVRLQDIQDSGSWRWLMNDLVPIFIFLIIGVFITFITYILTMFAFRKSQVKYDTIIKCTEMTGSVPDMFSKAVVYSSKSIPMQGRTHLVLSIVCAMISLFMIIGVANAHGRTETVLFASVLIAFAVAAVLLFIEFNKRSNSEDKSNQL